MFVINTQDAATGIRDIADTIANVRSGRRQFVSGARVDGPVPIGFPKIRADGIELDVIFGNVAKCVIYTTMPPETHKDLRTCIQRALDERECDGRVARSYGRALRFEEAIPSELEVESLTIHELTKGRHLHEQINIIWDLNDAFACTNGEFVAADIALRIRRHARVASTSHDHWMLCAVGNQHILADKHTRITYGTRGPLSRVNVPLRDAPIPSDIRGRAPRECGMCETDFIDYVYVIGGGDTSTHTCAACIYTASYYTPLYAYPAPVAIEDTWVRRRDTPAPTPAGPKSRKRTGANAAANGGDNAGDVAVDAAVRTAKLSAADERELEKHTNRVRNATISLDMMTARMVKKAETGVMRVAVGDKYVYVSDINAFLFGPDLPIYDGKSAVAVVFCHYRKAS